MASISLSFWALAAFPGLGVLSAASKKTSEDSLEESLVPEACAVIGSRSSEITSATCDTAGKIFSKAVSKTFPSIQCPTAGTWLTLDMGSLSTRANTSARAGTKEVGVFGLGEEVQKSHHARR